MFWNRRKRRIPPEIRRALRLLRRRIRLYVLAEGLTAGVIVIGLAFWLGLAIDWTFEPSREIRVAAWGVLVLATLWVLFHYILRRVFVRLRDQSLALLLERRFPHLGERLLTAVELGRSTLGDVHPALLGATTEQARQYVQGLDVVEVLNPRPLNRKVLLAVGILVSVIVFGIANHAAFAFYLERLKLSDATWPRRVDLSIDEFPEDAPRRVRMARDSEFTLTVRASLTEDHVAPDEVEIRYESEDGSRGRDLFTRIGDAVPGRDRYQLFRYRLSGVAQSLVFDIVGGDDRIDGLAIDVVDRPQVIDLSLECTYPTYTARPSEVRSVVGPLRLPEGTRMVLRGKSTKPLRQARLHDADSGEDAELRFAGAQQITSFEFPLSELVSDRLLLLTLNDTDEVESREAVRVSLTKVVDHPPEIAARLYGVGTSITADARVPFKGVIEDEYYGAQAAWFKYRAGDAGAVELPFARHPSGAAQFDIDEVLDLRAVDAETGQRRLVLEPGQQLTIQIEASDRYDLGNEPHVGTSQAFQLEVVTPAQLRAILEQRELSLRQRFESIYDKMNDTRDLLTRVEFGTPEDDSEAPPASEEQPADSAASEDADASPEKASAAGEAGERQLTRRRLRVAGSRQNVNQSSHETLGVADAFDEIQQELINNRIDTEELLDRIRDLVAGPLRRIGGEMMPALAQQLDVLQSKIDDEQAGPEELAEAIRLTDEILIEMRAALDKMLELESYNEILDLLRGIIRDQDELGERTKEKQRDQLRSLLE
jgi:hypothetical protein